MLIGQICLTVLICISRKKYEDDIDLLRDINELFVILFFFHEIGFKNFDIAKSSQLYFIQNLKI